MLRRLLRRSIRNLRLLSGAQRGGGAAASTGFMHELTNGMIERERGAVPGVAPTRRASTQSLPGRGGAQHLRTGTAIFDVAVETAARAGRTTMTGAEAFQLHDTYGFPIASSPEMASTPA